MALNLQENKRFIGMWGYPDPEVLSDIKAKYPEHEIIDLDINYQVPDSGLLPDAYCRIIRNIVDNSIYLKDKMDVIVASIGEEKCDSARLTALLLKDIGFNVIETRFETYDNRVIQVPISTSNLKLADKIDLIMANIVKKQDVSFKQSKARFGFWGVPPNDMSFLDLFPNETHVYGWVRCVEAQRPADIDLEMYVDEDVPTVFFVQTFCSKMQIAKYLAKKYNGLYIDVDDIATNSFRAKVEAFIKLR